MVSLVQTPARTYDRVIQQCVEPVAPDRGEARVHYINKLIELLPRGAAVLETGCGWGLPMTARLAQHFTVTGVDDTAENIEMARRFVPNARLIHTDLERLMLPAASFDAVVALSLLTRLPDDELTAALHAIARWLRPGGLFVAALRSQSAERQIEANWLGEPFALRFFDGAARQHLVEQAGLWIIDVEAETTAAAGQPFPYLWVMARKGRL